MSLEELVGSHVHSHIQVARPGATLSGSAFARYPDPLAFVDAGRYLHLHLALRRAATRSPAVGTGLLDHLAGPRTARTDPGLDELAKDGPPNDPDLSPPSASGQVLIEEGSVVPAPSQVAQTP